MDKKGKATENSIITTIKKETGAAKSVETDLIWLNQCICLLEQNTELNILTRDQFMTENVLWINRSIIRIQRWFFGLINKKPLPV
ncbi:erythromycin esterase [Chryseobacterium sp. StRB126]|nr:erythromycin esterase [Chryseobacterium sp. StRB126]